MKFLADENFPIPAFTVLLGLGLDIQHIGLINAGLSDEKVIELAINQDSVLLIFDSDYGTLVFKKNYRPKAVIYFRLFDFEPTEPAYILNRIIRDSQFEVAGFLTVIEKETIHQRKIPLP